MPEKETKNTLPSPQDFFEWKANQICNEKDPSKLQQYKNLTYEEFCIMYRNN
jgi:hypothetical protein